MDLNACENFLRGDFRLHADDMNKSESGETRDFLELRAVHGFSKRHFANALGRLSTHVDV